MIKLYHGDCLEIMKSIPDKSIDLVLTDPPYELETHGGGNRKQWKNIHNNFIEDLSFGFNYEKVFNEFLRVCKTPNILIFCSNKQISKIMSWFEERKLSTTLLCWYKRDMFLLQMENIKAMLNLLFMFVVKMHIGIMILMSV